MAGLGGRPITLKSISELVDKALYGSLPEFSFMDLDVELVERELERNLLTRRSGPMAENLLKDLGTR